MTRLSVKLEEIGVHNFIETKRGMEDYVDMALYYARSDAVYKDYMIKETNLQETAEKPPMLYHSDICDYTENNIGGIKFIILLDWYLIQQRAVPYRLARFSWFSEYFPRQMPVLL